MGATQSGYNIWIWDKYGVTIRESESDKYVKMLTNSFIDDIIKITSPEKWLDDKINNIIGIYGTGSDKTSI